MKQLSSLFILLLFAMKLHAQIEYRTLISIDSCKKRWQYFQLHDTISGTVISYIKYTIPCGRTAGASITYVQSNSGDTIRVLQFCDIKNWLHKGDKVNVFNSFLPEYGFGTPFEKHALTCSILKTYCAEISLLK
jgi:hypothetical protein